MKKLSIVMLAAVLAMGALRAEESANIPSSKKNFHLFLLMGQSNMSGGVGLAAGDTQAGSSCAENALCQRRG